MFAIIDIETTGLEKDARVLAVGLMLLNGRYKLVTNPKELEQYKLIGHNIKFDIERLNAFYGLNLEPYLDTQIISYLHEPTEKQQSLKYLASKHFKAKKWNENTFGLRKENGEKATEIAQVLWHFKKPGFRHTEKGKLLYNEMLKYLQMDCKQTLNLFSLYTRLTKQEQELARFLTKLDWLMETKYDYFYLDMPLLYTKKIQAEKELKRLKNKLSKTINLNSSRQVADYIQKTLNIPIEHKTSAGKPSVAYDSIVALSKQYPRIKWLQDYAQYKKLYKAYTSFLKPWLDLNGRFKPQFLLTKTVTGRTSCINPNIQQIPKGELRELFKAPAGYDFVEVDYSQMELRVIADVAQVAEMLRAYHNDKDLHSQTASILFDTKEPTQKQRQIGKTANFGLIYGMSAKGFKDYTATQGINLTIQQAELIRSKFLNTYKELNEYYYKVTHDLKSQGYTENLIGRRYKVDKRTITNQTIRSGINAPIQSLASDILLNSLYKALTHERYGKDYKIIGTVHDSILLYVKTGLDLEPFFNELMCSIEELQVPLKIDYNNYGKGWK